MSRFGFEEMQAIQKELQEKYLEQWGGLDPRKGRDSLLWMMIEAGEAVRYGVAHMRALRMVTINAAKALRVDNRMGSLTPGKDADVVLWSAVPALDMSARVRYTIINGKIVYQDQPSTCG